MTRKELMKRLNLKAVVLVGGVRFEKRLLNAEMNKAIWDIEPTDRQLSSKQWLKQNGWRANGK